MRIGIFGSMDVPEQDGIEVVHLDIHNYDKCEHLFDQVIVGNALQELPRSKVMEFLGCVYNMIRDMGELVLYVPSAEWAAKQIFTNKPDNVTYYMLYGEDTKPFRACYSMLALRTQVERAGFITRSATESILKIGSTDGGTFVMPVHSLVAVRNNSIGGK